MVLLSLCLERFSSVAERDNDKRTIVESKTATVQFYFTLPSLTGAALGVDPGSEAIVGRESQGGAAGVREPQRRHHHRRHGRPARPLRHALPPLRELAVSVAIVTKIS